jgi:hypothetical protein
MGLGFRAHVKTLKVSNSARFDGKHVDINIQCCEITRLMLGTTHHKVVASTLREIRGLQPLIDGGSVTEVCCRNPLVSTYMINTDVGSVRVALPSGGTAVIEYAP